MAAALSGTAGRLWRAAATGFCFAVFGLGGVALGLSVFPALRLAYPDPRARRRAAKRIIHLGFRAFVELMRLLGVLSYRVAGLDRLDRPGLLVLANHPSLIDVVFLVSFIPQADCLVKRSLLDHPFLRWPVRAAGYISYDEAETTLEACRRSFDEGNVLIVFPEGTRSVPGKPIRLQRGAAQIAVRARKDVTPVLIRATDTNLTKDSVWYRPPARAMRFSLTVEPDIRLAPFLKAGRGGEPLAARLLTEHLTAYFEKERSRASH